MKIEQLIEYFGFLILNKENEKSIVYAVNVKSQHYILMRKWAKLLANLPICGSNAYLGNYYSIDKSSIWKKYRLSLSDFDTLNDEDLFLRINILKNINKFKDEDLSNIDLNTIDQKLNDN